MITNKIEMGFTNFIIILVFIICVSSCDIAVDPDGDLEKINCDSLKTGIINIDSRIVKTEVNKLVTDLKPNVTSNDRYGHKENVSVLMSRLKAQCGIEAELICYACIETNPPQSEILVVTDSVGFPIKRVIDMWTSADSILSCVRIHE